MADFLDFDSLELNVDEQVNGAKEHPLKGMKTGAKMAYVGGLLFACHADDNSLQKEERSLVMGVAHSLGVGKEEVDELAEMIVGLTDKIGYLKEIVATLNERKTILFFLCDMIKAMGADGELNENAQKLIGAVEKLARLDEKDVTVILNYEKALVSQTMVDLKTLDLGDEFLIEWFLPDMAKTKKLVVSSQSAIVDGSESNGKVASKTRKSSSKVKNNVFQSSADIVANESAMTPLKSKIPFSKALEEAFKKFKRKCSDSTIYIGNVPMEKYLNAHESMCVQEKEHLLQHDSTLWGGAREGIIFSNKALYCKETMGYAGWRAEWSDLVDSDDAWLESDNKTIHLGENRTLCVYMMDESSREPFCDLLNDILEKIKSGKYEFGC